MRKSKETPTPPHSTDEKEEIQNDEGRILDVSGFENPIFSPEEIEEYGQPKGWLSAVIRGEGASIKIKMSRKDLISLFSGWMRDEPHIEGVMIEALKRNSMRQLLSLMSEEAEDRN